MEEKFISENQYSSSEIEKNSLYFYWREVQRAQLGISANVYLTFATAISGYLINYMTNNKIQVSCCISACSLVFLILSIFSFGLFTHNRLKDFRKTAKLYKQGKTIEQVAELTESIGDLTWNFYYAQIIFLTLGFIFSLITIFNFIYL